MMIHTSSTPITINWGGGESNYATILPIAHWCKLRLPCGRMGQASCGRVLRPLYGGDLFGKPKVEYEGGMGSGGPDRENKGQYNLLGFSCAMAMMAGPMITSNCKATGEKP
jgi:hypothetical protein